MNNEYHSNKMARHVTARTSQTQLMDDTAMSGSIDMPFGNFFGDDFLTLLYRSNDPCSITLEPIKASLHTVADRHHPRHERAKAAVMLGRFVREHYGNSDTVITRNAPRQWFELARQLNSVVGAHELAKTMLNEYGLKVEFDLQSDPLPRLERTSDTLNRPDPKPSRDVVHAWRLGARVSTRHVQRHFLGWRTEDFHCALACIVNYLTLLPFQRKSEPDDSLTERRHALRWLRPVWNRLIRAASEQCHAPDDYHAALIEQQLAVFVWLDEMERNPNTAPEPVRQNTTARLPASGELTIIKGEIPKSSDRAENDYLKTFEVLREPMAFQHLPAMDDLEQTRATLKNEFPWATDVVAAVMNELIARKRHGAVRLGITPILLAGEPGTGKTRFAQRLSELLDTPNTVINLAGMSDVKVLKGVTRGWSSNRPSRMIEFISQTKVANPLFILDEIDKTGVAGVNGGDPQEALLDLLEPGNAHRYQDIYLMTECDLSHCLYIATCNSLQAIPEPLLSRLHPVLFPAPGPEHAEVILKGILRDIEKAWDLPPTTLALTPWQTEPLRGLSAREMRRAVMALLSDDSTAKHYTQH